MATLSLFGQQQAARASKQMHQYSNTGYVLLGLIVEKVAAQSLPDYLHQHVFKRYTQRSW